MNTLTMLKRILTNLVTQYWHIKPNPSAWVTVAMLHTTCLRLSRRIAPQQTSHYCTCHTTHHPGLPMPSLGSLPQQTSHYSHNIISITTLFPLHITPITTFPLHNIAPITSFPLQQHITQQYSHYDIINIQQHSPHYSYYTTLFPHVIEHITHYSHFNTTHYSHYITTTHYIIPIIPVTPTTDFPS